MILFLTNAPTEILALRSIIEGLPDGFPGIRAAAPGSCAVRSLLEGVDIVVVRLLGGSGAWREGFQDLRMECLRRGIPLLAFGGEAAPDAELTAASTVPSATVATAFEYLVHGGLENLEQMLRFVSDTVAMTGFGFEPPRPVPMTGVYRDAPGGDGPLVAVLFYRAHLIAGNTMFVDSLCDELEQRGCRAVAVWAYSLRPSAEGRVDAIEVLAPMGIRALVTTVLVSGTAADDGLAWDASALGSLGVPVVQAVTSTSSRRTWEESAAGLSPIDVAMRVAVPEFDGRIVSVPFSFEEVVDDGDTLGTAVSAYRPVPDRVERVSGTVARLCRLGAKQPADRRVALVLSAYPTKRSRLGNAVALDTPASVVELLRRMREQGYRIDRIPASGDDLMAELADGLAYDTEEIAPAQAAAAMGHLSADAYRRWWETVDEAARSELEAAWGEAPGRVHIDDAGLVFSGVDLGGVLVAIQPPRGFGENPVAVYHSPDLAPTHHYLGFYRWLDEVWGADAVVHVGKHGTLEWLPGKGVGLSAQCWPDIALGDMPFVYPFVVNDPGEGTQAKRRSHAVIVDHLLPPMTRADTYDDDVARLEQLLDEYASVSALDPSKLPMIRGRIWELLVGAELHRDLGVSQVPDGEAFDDLVNHIDGYLCELKDAQIRGGLHVLGRAPGAEAMTDMLLAITRLPQPGVPSLRQAVAERMGVDLTAPARAGLDAVEEECRALLTGRGTPEGPDEERAVAWVESWLRPALEATPAEIEAVLAALDGRWIAPGPSGAPTRGMAHVLPTGRNFYSVDPKALPSQLAWEVGSALAERLVERHVEEHGRPPSVVGLVVWGTAAMRTGGDDVAEALALMGVRPVWAPESGRVTGVELIPEAELGRPRVDVVLRISGFFRDAFPHLIALLDEAAALAGFADGDPRIFGSKPGTYGSGILALIESGNWRDDADLAEVYTAWSGWSYSRGAMGAPAADAMRRRFATIEVAVKNQDNREHDIFDSDDYMQDHGGMIATIRALTGRDPDAVFGDSADPTRPRVRSLAEEAARVVRTRVVNPKWVAAMTRHGYKGAFEMAATVDYLYGYDATARVVEDWMYERVVDAYVADPEVRKFMEASNPWALRSIAERLLEAERRGLWNASDDAIATLRRALLEAEGWEESR